MTKDESEIKAMSHRYGYIKSKRPAGHSFAALKNIWKTNKSSNRTKIPLFKSNDLSVIIYAAESWKVNEGMCQKLDVLRNMCLQIY